MSAICEWLSNNALAIFISAIVSFVASKIYFDKANRESVLMSIVFPIVKILEKNRYNRKNYESLFAINSSYAAKYLKRKERNKLLALLSSYRNVCRYTKESADTDCIMDYYHKKIEENNIRLKPCEIYDDEGKLIYYDFPPEHDELCNYIYEIVSSYEFIEAPIECAMRIIEAFEHYTKKWYTDKKILFFDDCSIDVVIKTSEVTKEWKNRFMLADKCINEFLNLPICKNVNKIINDSSVNEYDKKQKKINGQSTI